MSANCLTTSTGIDASSLRAASIAALPSPPICPDTIRKWMLCG